MIFEIENILILSLRDIINSIDSNFICICLYSKRNSVSAYCRKTVVTIIYKYNANFFKKNLPDKDIVLCHLNIIIRFRKPV